jgi:hypothetical protein
VRRVDHAAVSPRIIAVPDLGARERMLPHTGGIYDCIPLVYLMVRDLAALLARESFEVFSAKLKRGAKKPSMQDSLAAALV